MMDAKRPLTALEVREKLIERGYDIDRHKNPLASIHTTLKRLRTQRKSAIGILAPAIRQILRESGEEITRKDCMIYLSGPMSSIPLHNFPAFEAAATRLRAHGHEVVSPHEVEEVNHDAPKSWDYYVRKDIRLMMDCDHIVMLPGWRASKGARLEHHIAVELGFVVSEYDKLILLRD